MIAGQLEHPHSYLDIQWQKSHNAEGFTEVTKIPPPQVG